MNVLAATLSLLHATKNQCALLLHASSMNARTWCCPSTLTELQAAPWVGGSADARPRLLPACAAASRVGAEAGGTDSARVPAARTVRGPGNVAVAEMTYFVEGERP